MLNTNISQAKANRDKGQTALTRLGSEGNQSMPVAYMYDSDVYIHNWIFNHRDKSCAKLRVMTKILQHNYSINMSHKKASTKMTKLTCIEQHAPTIRSFYFRSDTYRGDNYRKAMNKMTSCSFTVKNVLDDADFSILYEGEHSVLSPNKERPDSTLALLLSNGVSAGFGSVYSNALVIGRYPNEVQTDPARVA